MIPSRTTPRPGASSPITGTLGRTSLAELMVYFARREDSGTLVLNFGGREGLIVFESGAPVKAHSPWQPATLGKLLVRMGCIDSLTDAETAEQARSSRVWQGAVLLARGLVDTASLQQALREQAGLRVIELFRRYDGQTTFAFHRGQDWLRSSDEPEGAPVDPWYLLWNGCKRRSTDPMFSASLSLLGQQRVVLRDDAELHRFGFGPTETAVLSWLKEHPSAVGELMETGWLSPDRMRALLYVLFITHSLAFHDARQSQMASKTRDKASSSFPPAVPRSGTMRRVLPKSEADQGARVSQQLAPPWDEADTLQAAPPSDRPPPQAAPPSDRPPPQAAPPSDRPPQSMRLQELRGSVRQIMGSPSTPPPEPEPPASERPLSRGAASSQRPSPANQLDALRLLRDAQEERLHGDLARAEAHARAAYAARASDPQIATELACILVMQPERRQLGDLGECLDLTRAAIAKRPEMDAPYYVRGLVHQALGMHEQACKDFRDALARNPRSGEAAEQIQAYTRRYREKGSLEPQPESAPPRAGLGAVLSRFFQA